MGKLMVCGFVAMALTANAVEIIDLTAAASSSCGRRSSSRSMAKSTPMA